MPAPSKPAGLPAHAKLSPEAVAQEAKDKADFERESVAFGARSPEYPKLLDAPEFAHLMATFKLWGARLDKLRTLVAPRQRVYDLLRRAYVPQQAITDLMLEEATAFFDLHGWEPARPAPQPPEYDNTMPDWAVDLGLVDGPTAETSVDLGPTLPLIEPEHETSRSAPPTPSPAQPLAKRPLPPFEYDHPLLPVLTRIAVALEHMADRPGPAVKPGASPLCPRHGNVMVPTGGEFRCPRPGCRQAHNARGYYERR